MEYTTLLPQIQRLHTQVPKHRTLAALIRTLFGSGFPKEKHAKSLAYIYLTRLLWEYIAEALPYELQMLEEPECPEARQVKWKKRIVTQELAKAILDYHAITQEIAHEPLEKVLIWGANPWQLSYVFLNQHAENKFVIVDTLTPLQNAYKHFGKLFPEKKLWMCPPFVSFEQIASKFHESSICFIQPSYLPQLPEGVVDLGVMVDVFDQYDQHEIGRNFKHISRLVTQYVYFKQCKKGRIKEADYLIPEEWEEVFWRTCKLYPFSFEALFEKMPLQ